MQAATDVWEDSYSRVDSRLGCEVALSYRVVQHLASGGTARVYLAEHVRYGTYAAAKFSAGRSAAEARLLRHEAHLLSRLAHSNIVRALDAGRTSDGSEYLLLEYLRGIDLAEWITIAGARAPRRRLLKMLDQLADAIDHVHASGVVHGDIKPANVMFDPNGDDQIKLIDFGLAFEPALQARRAAGTGTPGYMAPEQIRGGHCSPASDRFAFAALAFELLTGVALQPEASGERTHPAAEARGVDDRRCPAPARLGPVFSRALHDEPEARFASAREFVAALN